MLTLHDRQKSFYDADSVCEQLIPEGSFCRKFREIVAPLVDDSMFESMYCLGKQWETMGSGRELWHA